MLPAAVRRKADEATRLMTAAAGARSQPPAEAAATPASQPAATDAAALQQKLSDTLETLRIANERAAALQGKLNAEGPRAAGELRATKDDLKKANERITALEAEVKKKVDAMTLTGLTEEDRRVAGDDLVKVATKIAMEVVDGRLATELAPFRQRVDVLEQMSREQYFLALDDGIPNWESLNEDPKFVAWLNQVDPVTNRLRMDRVKRAEAARQGNLVVEIFRAFLEGREIGVPKPTEPTPLPKPVHGAPETRVDLDTGGGNATTVALDEHGKRLWTRAQIKAHYDSKTAGAWRGKDKEWRDLELDIYAAYREGRVKG